jgi:uncharacterized damage-inducible protein DinB
MSRPIMADAFGHHAWATLVLIDACAALDPARLEAVAPGTYGSILATTRHLVEADRWYLTSLTAGRLPAIDEQRMGLAQLRDVMVENAAAWSEYVASEPDADAVVVGRNDDGSTTLVPVGIRLAQALHHGTDHRSQICSALTMLGVHPPQIDVWAFADQDGRVVDVPAPA